MPWTHKHTRTRTHTRTHGQTHTHAHIQTDPRRCVGRCPPSTLQSKEEVCYYPSSPLGSDCTNLPSPPGGDVSLSVSLFAYGEARMNCSIDRTVTFAQKQKVYFLILCNKDQILSLGEGASCLSVCCLFLCLFIQFSQHACFFNYTATLCHWELTSAAR